MPTTCSFTLVGTGPIGFSKAIRSFKKDREPDAAFERRTWKEKMHVDSQGNVFIPPMALQNCMRNIAQYLGEKIKGKGQSTYTKHFKAGILCNEPLMIETPDGQQITVDLVESIDVFVPSDGKQGGGKRVWKTFPVINEWKAKGALHILDPLLENQMDKVKEYLEQGGRFIGLGWFRPERSGYYGRYLVQDFKTSET